MNHKPLLMLAPMAGISDWPFRLLCQKQGADIVVSEMVSAEGFLSAPKTSRSYMELLKRSPQESNVLLQLFGHKPDQMARAAYEVEGLGQFDGIDLNFGCPARKVTSSGSGSALMKDLNLSRAIFHAVRKACSVRLSVKMRLGWDDSQRNAVELARIAQGEGLDAICVHGRTREQQYMGKADWEGIARVREAVTIPVYANGDVFSPDDAEEILRVTGAAGLAVGRGALGNPWIFRAIASRLQGEKASEIMPDERLSTAMWQMDSMISWKGEHSAILEMRKHLAWYLKGSRGAAAVRARLNTLNDPEEIKALMTEYYASQPS